MNSFYYQCGPRLLQRDLDNLKAHEFDVIIVGGGITGACVARDAVLRGLSVALLEKRDFSSATSGASSKLIHGGLRYLRYLEFGIVRESLRERRYWANNAPHMVETLGIVYPTSGRGKRSRWLSETVFTIYDWLAYDRNRVQDPDKRIPAHKHLSAAAVYDRFPGLKKRRLTGAKIFYDYQMHSPDRLLLDVLRDAAAEGAALANYTNVTGFVHEADRVTGVTVEDTLNGGQSFDVCGKVVVNATGPWADIVMGRLEGEAGSHHLVRSKGIHLVTRPLTDEYGIAIEYRGGHFFIVPWRGHSLIGTTDTVFEGNPDSLHVTEEDISSFLASVNRGYPDAKLSREDVLFSYAGLRPLVDTDSKAADEAQSTYTASRAAEVVDHADQNGPQGVITAIGGKWTTSRALAEKVTDRCLKKLGHGERPCLTRNRPTFGGAMERFECFMEELHEQYPEHSSELLRHLARNYGTECRAVLELMKEKAEYGNQLAEDRPETTAEIVYGVRTEMARNLEDVLFRRTALGLLGHPGQEAVDRAATLMAAELDWSPEERARQVALVERRYREGSMYTIG